MAGNKDQLTVLLLEGQNQQQRKDTEKTVPSYRCCCCCCCRLRPCAYRCCVFSLLGSVLMSLVSLYIVFYIMVRHIGSGSVSPPVVPPPPLQHLNCSGQGVVALGVSFVGSSSLGVCWSHSLQPSQPFEVLLRPLDCFPTAKAAAVRIAGNLTAAAPWLNVTTSPHVPLVPSCSYRVWREPLAPSIVGNGGPGSVNVTLLQAGYCGNVEDAPVLLAVPRAQWGDIISSSILGCLSSLFDPACIQAALQQRLQTSVACTRCWRAMAMCSLSACGGVCALAPHGEDCKTCTLQACTPAAMTCSGMPAWMFPEA